MARGKRSKRPTRRSTSFHATPEGMWDCIIATVLRFGISHGKLPAAPIESPSPEKTTDSAGQFHPGLHEDLRFHVGEHQKNLLLHWKTMSVSDKYDVLLLDRDEVLGTICRHRLLSEESATLQCLLAVMVGGDHEIDPAISHMARTLFVVAMENDDGVTMPLPAEGDPALLRLFVILLRVLEAKLEAHLEDESAWRNVLAILFVWTLSWDTWSWWLRLIVVIAIAVLSQLTIRRGSAVRTFLEKIVVPHSSLPLRFGDSAVGLTSIGVAMIVLVNSQWFKWRPEIAMVATLPIIFFHVEFRLRAHSSDLHVSASDPTCLIRT